MTSLSILLRAIYAKLQTSAYSPVVTVNESADLINDLKTNRYRLELSLDVLDADGYTSQRDIEWEAKISVWGYIRKEGMNLKNINELNLNPTPFELDDLSNIGDFAIDTHRLIVSLMDDKQNETFVCPGFSHFNGKNTILLDFELYNGITVFNVVMGVVFSQEDTSIT